MYLKSIDLVFKVSDFFKKDHFFWSENFKKKIVSGF